MPQLAYVLDFSQDLGQERYRSGTVNSNTVNSNFHLIQSYCEIFFNSVPTISCLKCTVNSNFHLIRSKTLLTNDFELTVPDLYHITRMHFSRMRTARSLTVSHSIQWGGDCLRNPSPLHADPLDADPRM